MALSRDQRDALARALRSPEPTSHEGLVRLLAMIEVLGSNGSASDVPHLLDVALARVWPLVAADESVVEAAHLAIRTIVSRMSTRELVGLDQQLRSRRDESRWPNVRPPMVDEISRGPARTTMLGLLAGHPSGYVREAAVDELATLGPEALPWLLVRTIDWVAPIRIRASAAVRALLEHRNIAHVLHSLPLALRLENFTRVDPRSLVMQIVRFLAEQPDAVLAAGLDDPDRFVRRGTLELLRQIERIKPEHLERALRDRDVAVRAAAARLVTTDATPEMAALRATLCRDRSARVRASGLELEQKSDPERARQLLREALTDINRSVRELARTHVRDIGVVEHYRELVTRPNPSVGAIAGLGEIGGAHDWERLVPALDASPARARAALRSMHTLNRRDTRELRLMMVDDARRGVSRTAAESLRGELWETDEPTLRAFLGSPIVHVREHAVRLVARLRGWKPVEILLACDRAEHFELIEQALWRWIVRRRHVRLRLTQADASRLHSLLDHARCVGPLIKAELRRLLDSDVQS